jgi:hypothetical protein
MKCWTLNIKEKWNVLKEHVLWGLILDLEFILSGVHHDSDVVVRSLHVMI